MRSVIVVLALVLAASPAAAQPPGLTDAVPVPVDHGRDTSRAMFGAGAAVFANFPMSMSDPGASLFASRPLWLGNRYRIFQWVLDAHALAGFGTTEKHAYVVATPQFGCNLYFGSVFGLEFRVGAGGILQLGERTEPGFVMTGGGGYVFRLWDDDRKRLKLWLSMASGFYVTPDPGNDTASAGVLSGGLGYETPL